MRAVLRMMPLFALVVAMPLAAAPSAISASEAANSPTPTDARTFAANVASSDQFEIRSSKALLGSAAGPAVKQLAAMIVSDHEASSEKLTALLAAMPTPLEPPTKMAPKQAAMLRGIHGVGDAYARSYLDAQITAHANAIAMFLNYSARGDDESLKAFAKETVPTLQNHMTQAQTLRRALK